MTPFPAHDRASQKRLRVGVAVLAWFCILMKQVGELRAHYRGTLLFSIKGHALPVVTSWGKV